MDEEEILRKAKEELAAEQKALEERAAIDAAKERLRAEAQAKEEDLAEIEREAWRAARAAEKDQLEREAAEQASKRSIQIEQDSEIEKGAESRDERKKRFAQEDHRNFRNIWIVAAAILLVAVMFSYLEKTPEETAVKLSLPSLSQSERKASSITSSCSNLDVQCQPIIEQMKECVASDEAWNICIRRADNDLEPMLAEARAIQEAEKAKYEAEQAAIRKKREEELEAKRKQEVAAKKAKGNWTYRDRNDDFDGKVMRSDVMGIAIITSEYADPPRIVAIKRESEGAYLYIVPGDGYICGALDGKVNVDIILDDKDRHRTGMIISDDREALFFRNDRVWLDRINAANYMKLRFTDNCGDTSQHEFNISGTTRF